MKIYKLKLPDGNIVEIAGYYEFRSYLKENNIGKTQVFESYDKNKPTRAGYQLVEIVNSKDEVEENVIELEGKVERIPKVREVDNTYYITYGKREIVITEEQLSKIRKLYCNTHGMTIEKVCLEMNLLREELIAIKTAFSFVKSSAPFTDKEIDSLEVEEMADIARNQKKKAFFRKLEDLKVKDMEEELKKLHKKDYYMNKVIEAMKDIKVKDYENVIESPSKLTYIVNLADLHVGASVHNMINDYNLEEFRKRMAIYAEEVFKEMSWLNPERIIVINLGDSLSGVKNIANRIEADCGLIDSVKCATEEIASFLKHLSHFGKVEYYNVHGNHSDIHKDKILNIEEENLERLITWGLSNIFSESNRIEIHPAEDVIGIEVYGKLIACQHGHNNLSVEKLTGKFDKVPRLSLSGHFHSFQILTKGNTECVQVGTMMGSDSYAMSKGFTGKPSQLLIVVNEKWKVEYKPIYFNSKVGV